jgi:hypothetical protein
MLMTAYLPLRNEDTLTRHHTRDYDRANDTNLARCGRESNTIFTAKACPRENLLDSITR